LQVDTAGRRGTTAFPQQLAQHGASRPHRGGASGIAVTIELSRVEGNFRRITIGSTLATLGILALAAQRGMGHYIRTHFFDQTFRRLYHANAFDLALLIPYFPV